MSDRTQGSVTADSREQGPQGPQGPRPAGPTQAVPVGGAPSAAQESAPAAKPSTTKPAATKPAAGKPAGSGTPATAPGWGGATPARSAPVTSQTPVQSAAPGPTAKPQAAQPQQAAQARQAAKPQQSAAAQAPARPAQRPAAAAAPARNQATAGTDRASSGGAAQPSRGSSAQAAPVPATGGPGGPGGPGRPTGGSGGGGSDESGGKVRGSVKEKGRGPRRARLQLRHIDTWSALKISLVLAIALFFVWMVAVGVLYGVLNGLGVFTTLNDLIGQLGSSSGDDSGAASAVITPGIVFGGAAVIGAVNIVLFTALCTVGTFVYNLCSDLVGGLEVTLAERD